MPQAVRSTRPASNAWPLDELDDEGIDTMCSIFGVASRGKARLDKLRDRLADPELLASILTKKSAFELVLLEVMVDYGGFVELRTLWDEACRRAGVERRYTEQEIFAATSAVGCSLRSYAGESAAAVFDACYMPLCALLRGISLPRTPSAVPDEASGSLHRVRDTILAAARTLHCRVKQNKDGSPSRAQRRRFETGVAVEPDCLWQRLEDAVDARVVRGDGSGYLVPDPRQLMSVASDGAFTTTPDAASLALIELLVQRRVITTESLVRAEQRGHMPRLLPRDGLSSVSSYDNRLVRGRVEARMGAIVGAWVGTVDGTQVIALPGQPDEPSGHVLPNFEVILGPNTPLVTVAQLAVAAELVRIDTMVTLRLTPASIRAACRVGVDARSIIAALDQVDSRGVPETVGHSVREWADRVVTGRVLHGRVVVVADPVIDRLLASDASRAGLERIGEGVVHVSPSVTDAQLYERLDAAGVTIAPSLQTVAQATPSRLEIDEADAAHASLRSRVDAAVSKGDFPRFLASDPERSRAQPSDLLDDDVALPPAVAAEVRAALSRWHSRLKAHARKKIPAAALDADELIGTLAMLDPNERARILKRATKLPQVLRRAASALAEGRLAPWALDAALGPTPVPTVDAFPQLTPQLVRRLLDIAADDGGTVRLLLRSGNQTTVSDEVRIEAVVPRGRDLVVLAHDDNAERSFSFPLTQVASVLPEDVEIHDDTMLHALERLVRGRH